MPEMSDEDLMARLRNTEDNFVERKSAADFRDSLPAAVAFANSLPEEAPAVIFLPVRNDGRIESGQNLDDLQKKITKRVNQAYPPIAFIQRIITTAAGESVLAVIVWGSNQRPHFAGASFVRIGSETRTASETQFEELITSRNSKAREILKWKDKTVTWANMATNPERSGPIRGVAEVTVVDCNQFFMTVKTATGNLQSVPLTRVDISFDHSRAKLQLEIRPA